MLPQSRQVDSPRIKQKKHRPSCRLSWRLLLVIMLSNTIPATDVYAQGESEIELVNFAFANYLGTGFYASDGGKIFVLKIPLSTTLRPMTNDESGWVVTYPVTLGTANIDEIVGGMIPGLGDVGTISVIPGIEYHYPVLDNWRLIPFFDLGLARDVVNDTSTRVLGAGVKSFVTFDFDRDRLTLGNRLLYAEQKNLDRGNHSNFAVFTTALDYNFPTHTTIKNSLIDFSIYYINYYYIEDLVFVDTLDARISLENKDEVGFTVSIPDVAWLPDDTRLGFGVQMTKDANLYRISFGTPFF